MLLRFAAAKISIYPEKACKSCLYFFNQCLKNTKTNGKVTLLSYFSVEIAVRTTISIIFAHP